MKMKNRNAACLPLEGAHIEQPKSSLAWLFWRLLWIASAAYKADKAYYRALVIRVIEDGVVFFLGYAAIWSLCYVIGGIFDRLGVGM